MKRSFLFIIAVFLFFPLLAQYEVRGGSGRPYQATKNGITEIYLLNGMEGAQIRFTSSQSGTHQWYRYRESIDDAVPVPCTQSGNVSAITDIQESHGYYVEVTGMGMGMVWIVDYSRYVVHFSGLRVQEDEYRCERLLLVADANIPPVYYYTGGRRNTLQRNFLLTYHTLKWQEEQKIFTPKEESHTYEEIYPEIEVEAPLTNTTFTLTDSFAVHFGIAQAITSEEYRAVKVEAHFSYEKDREFADNEMHKGDSLSAPVNYTFTAYANEPVAAYYIWKILKKDDDVTGQYNQIAQHNDPVLRYPFEREGDYQIQLEVDGACADIQDVTRIIIGNSEVKIPNAFSPGSSPGVNDELKVSFKSITSFRAFVYNRWGNLLYQWSDPAKGWNGMVNGKYVPTGAYFVVVEYTDGNGQKKVAKRDVNILRGKNLTDK